MKDLVLEIRNQLNASPEDLVLSKYKQKSMRVR